MLKPLMCLFSVTVHVNTVKTKQTTNILQTFSHTLHEMKVVIFGSSYIVIYCKKGSIHRQFVLDQAPDRR